MLKAWNGDGTHSFYNAQCNAHIIGTQASFTLRLGISISMLTYLQADHSFTFNPFQQQHAALLYTAHKVAVYRYSILQKHVGATYSCR